jgi:predicted ester cyclase
MITMKTVFAAILSAIVPLGLASAAAGAHERTLTVEQARAIVAPLYESLNEPAKKDVLGLLEKATVPDYRSCSTNEDCLNRTQLATLFKSLGENIPDLQWKIVDIFTSGNRIIVRGEFSGTPIGPLYGVQPATGRAFRSMSIDVFTVRDGKLASAYHVENWGGAILQVQGHGH